MDVKLSKIVGNASLKDRISTDISGNTLSHAYIIEGPKGSGKHTLALRIAASINSGDCTPRPSSEKAMACGASRSISESSVPS